MLLNMTITLNCFLICSYNCLVDINRSIIVKMIQQKSTNTCFSRVSEGRNAINMTSDLT